MTVANGTLTYALGSLVKYSQQPTLYHVFIIVGTVVLAVGCVSIILAIICCTVMMTKRKRSNSKRLVDLNLHVMHDNDQAEL